MTATGPPIQPADGAILAAINVLTLRVEAMDAHHQRDLLAIERRLGAVEDALAGWADSYYRHTEHPPAQS